MSLPTLIQTGLSTLLDSTIVETLAENAKEKAVSVLVEHFTFTAYEITKAYQDSFGDALAAICVGLAAPDQKSAFLQKFLHSKITREFAEQIEVNYLQPFAVHHFGGVQSEALSDFRKQSIEQLKKFAKNKDQLFQVEKITEEDLAALITYKGTVAITDLVLEQMQRIAPVDNTLAAFLRYDDLLGKAMRFFFHEQMRQDERVEKTLAALQREALLIKVGENSQDLKQLIEKLDWLMKRLDLSQQIKPRDGVTQHNDASLKLIQEAAEQVKHLPTRHPEYSRLSLMVGSALSSTGDLEKAERFFIQAIENAANKADMALAYFNLFHVRLRRKTYTEALAALQLAITIDPDRYALHDVKKYPIVQLLGVGGMGCVFLCQNKNLLIKKEKLVAVKCFWESRKGQPEKVFREALAMRDIAGDYVPDPLDYGYYDNLKQERAYFVTAYIENAIDGEAWLEKYGTMDLKTCLPVGLQIAKGLQVAHDAGIYHLDLKPANILLKRTDTRVAVKIIDFGLSQVAPSLRQEATMRQGPSGFFGQAVFGTLDYAPPEQQGVTEYGKPSAKSDVFAFGATMYRLLTGENPRRFLERRLSNVPKKLRNLLSDCIDENPEQRPNVTQLVKVFSKLLKSKKLLKAATLIVPVFICLIIGYHVFVKIESKQPVEKTSQTSPFVHAVDTANPIPPNKPYKEKAQTREQPASPVPTIVESEKELDITGYDVVFAVDSTQGMDDYFIPIAEVLQRVIKHISESEGDDDIRRYLRIGLLFYRDRLIDNRCDIGYLTKWAQSLTDNINRVIHALKSAQVTGCSSEEPEEAVLEGLNRILIDTQWRDNAFKAIILVGDGPPHPLNHEKNPDQLSISSIVEKAARQNIRLLTFKLGDDDKAFKELALYTTPQNKGRYKNLAQGDIPAFKDNLLKVMIQEWEMLHL
jgi:serine/threonine protein kinase